MIKTISMKTTDTVNKLIDMLVLLVSIIFQEKF